MMTSDRSGGQKGMKAADTTALPVYLKIIRSRVFLVGAVLLILYTLCGFFLTPYLVERYTPRIIQKNLICESRIGKVRVNPFLFTFEANDFRISEKNGTPVSGFDRLFLDFELSSLFRWAWTFKVFKLENPKVSIIIARDGMVNFKKLIPEKLSPGQAAVSKNVENAENADDAPPRFILQNVTLQNGEIHIADLRQSEPARTDIMPLNIRLERISTLLEHKGPYSLKANLDDGGIMAWTGTITLHPLKSAGNLMFSEIKVGTLWKFIRDTLNIQEPKGRFNFNTDYAIDLSGEEPQLTLDNLGLQFVDLTSRLSDEKIPFFTLADARISGARFDLASRKLGIEKISFTDGSVRAFMDAEKTLNLQKIVRAPSGQGDAMQAGSKAENQGASEAGPPGPWDVGVRAVEIGGVAARFEDQGQPQGLTVGLDEFDAHFSVEAQVGGADTRLKVQHINTGLREIQISRRGDADALIRVPTMRLEEGFFDLSPQTFTVSRILLEHGHVDVVRESDGQVNLLTLTENSQDRGNEQQMGKTSGEKNAFAFLVKAIELADFSASVHDHGVKTEGSILDMHDINVGLVNVDGKSPMEVNVGFEVDKGGSFGVSGVVDPSVPNLRTEVSVTEFALSTLQPYIETHAAMALRSGVFSTQGVFVYGDPESEAELAYDGRFNVTGLNITDFKTEDTLLGWRKLKVSDIKFRLNPDLLEIPDVGLSGMDGKFIIAKDGTTNVSRVVRTREGEQAGKEIQTDNSADAEKGFPVFIHSLRIEDGHLYFADLSLRPQFATRIHNLDGVVIGASSAQDSRTQIQLDGEVDEYGMVGIKGEVNAFDPATYTDIAMKFKNLEMNSMTPYSGKFVGRRIKSGKLSLDLEYRIKDSKLKGDNQIVVDNLTLGERVESRHAVNLPLNLAIAILEDENGIINLGMPVSGDLEDPKFSYGHLIWKAFVNVIKKIVTSPFRALSAMLGEDTEDLDVIVFENGAYEVPPPEKEKLHRLAQALAKRPNLKVVVQGAYSPESDGFELKALNVRRLLAARLGVELEPGEDPGPPDYGNPDTQEALESIYIERYGPDNLEALKLSLSEELVSPEGVAKKTTVPSQEKKSDDPGYISKYLYKKLIEVEPLEEGALVSLADTRARAVIFQMVDVGKLAPERISTKESDALATGESAAAKLVLEAM